MKKIILSIIMFFLFTSTVSAININSSSFVAMDINSGRVFYEKNKDNKRLIASTTKIMTAIVAIENSNMEDLVEAKEEILTMYGSNIYIEYHEHMLMLDLLYGLMLRSGNDASIVIATHVSGSIEKFVSLMNAKAKELGMTNTIFKNPHGLDEESENYSTAYDLSILYSYAYRNEIFRKIVGTKRYKLTTEVKSYDWYNRNKILTMYDKATGGKTGYTPRAGKALVTSASNNDLDIVITSFNSIYDYDLHAKVYEDIFYNYSNTLILDKNNFNLKNNPFDGVLYIKDSVYYPLSNNEKKKITKLVNFYNLKKYNNGDEVGEVYLYLDDDIISTAKIYIKKNDKTLYEKIKEFIHSIKIFN